MDTVAGSRFEMEFRPLSESAPHFGEVAPIPWDEETFGFRVADYRPGEFQRPEDGQKMAAALDRWSRENDVELIGCRVPGDSFDVAALLQANGFRFIETQLRGTLPRLRPEAFAPSRLTPRTAEPGDHARIAEIAETAFSFGRYHADPRFPRVLADRRYRSWMERALSSPSPTCRVLVLGPVGRCSAFLHAEVAPGHVDLRLAAAAPGDSGIAAVELFRGTLRAFAAEGVTMATAVFSAANTAVANLYASLGFRFHDPKLLFHWHRPGSRHLISSAAVVSASPAYDGPPDSR